MTQTTRQVSFTQMKDGTRDDYQMLHKLEEPYHRGTAKRLLAELARQGNETLEGYKITRLEHALQSATRARRDGASSDWVVAALLHDIGDGLAPQNHDKFAAEILRPFMPEEITWVVEHHGIFQMYYYAHHLAGTANCARNTQATPITRPVSISANAGISPVSIRNTQWTRWTVSPPKFRRFSPARPGMKP